MTDINFLYIYHFAATMRKKGGTTYHADGTDGDEDQLLPFSSRNLA